MESVRKVTGTESSRKTVCRLLLQKQHDTGLLSNVIDKDRQWCLPDSKDYILD